MFDTPRDRRAGSAHDAARRRLEALGSSLAGELEPLDERGADPRIGAAPPAVPAGPFGRRRDDATGAAGARAGLANATPSGRHAARPSRGPLSTGDQQDQLNDGLGGRGTGRRGDDADDQMGGHEPDRFGLRMGARLVDRVPLPVRSAVWGRFGAHHLAALVLVLAVALCLAAWWALSARPQVQPVPRTVSPASAVPAPIPPAAPPSATAAPGPASPTPIAGQTSGTAPPSTPAGDTAGEQLVVVDVAGKVRRPGIVTLPWGSRVADALEAAGGARAGADLVMLNLARVLVDGEQLLVGIEAVTVPAPVTLPDATVVPQPGATPGVPTLLVNLNTATLADLDTLPGVGPVTAEAILTWRTENGAFSTVDELLEVSGIGDVTLEELRDLVTV